MFLILSVFLLVLVLALWLIFLVATPVALLISIVFQFLLARKSRQAQIPSLSFRHFLRQRSLFRRVLRISSRLTLAIVVMLICAGFIRSWVDTHNVRTAIRSATKLVLRTGGNCHRRREYERVVFETTDLKTMQEFARKVAAGLTIPGVACMCCGELTCDLYRGNSLSYSFSIHHREHVRILGDQTGDRDLSFISRNALGRWLKQTGIETTLADAKAQSQKELFSDLERSSKSK